MKEAKLIDPTKLHAIDVIEFQNGKVAIKMANKLKALELLGRHLGMF